MGKLNPEHCIHKEVKCRRHKNGRCVKHKCAWGVLPPRKPQTYSPERRAKMRELALSQNRRPPSQKGNTGPLASNWKGGITPIQKQIRNSPEYAYWRKHVFQRDDYTCQACGKRGGKLQADHELPFALFPDLRLEILNGRTLCVDCHRKTPSFKGRVYNSFYNQVFISNTN
jgi:5-methylcytosine-specific restriction endonuclease McrA